MAKQTINIGASPNDGTGTPLRTAFDYTNQNFTELYTATGPSGNNIVVPGSATITGDLTVDTNVLKVNTTNNRVGINTASPAQALDVASGNLQVRTGGTIYSDTFSNYGAALQINSAGSLPLRLQIGGSNAYEITSGNIHTWSNVGGVAGTAMTLNATGLGVGVGPTYKLQSVGIAAATSSTVNGSGGNLIGALLNSDDANSGVNPGVDLRRWTGTALNHGTTYIATNATGDTLFYNGTAASNTRATSLKMTLDASGRLLVGPTSANASGGVLQLSSGITFPATQVASSDANTLDDYEEGTWTGTLKGSVSDPTTPVTATGKYTKIGRQVFVEITYNGVNTTGASGNITVTGLPFSCGSNVNGVGTTSLNQIGTFTGSPYVFLSQTTSVLELYGNVSAGAGAAITHNAGTLRYMTISMTYTV